MFKSGKLLLGANAIQKSSDDPEAYLDDVGAPLTRASSLSPEAVSIHSSDAGMATELHTGSLMEVEFELDGHGEKAQADIFDDVESPFLNEGESTILNLPKDLAARPRRILACESKDVMHVITMQYRIHPISRIERRLV